MSADRIVKKLLENDDDDDLDWTPEPGNPDDSTAPELSKLRKANDVTPQQLMRFKTQAAEYVQWIAHDTYAPEDISAILDAENFSQAEAILAKYDTGGADGFLSMISQGFFT